MLALVNIITRSRIRGTIISNNLDKIVIIILYRERLIGFKGLVPLRKAGARRE